MFEITQPAPAQLPMPTSRPPGDACPERRVTGSDLAHWLRRMLDEIDYGMLMVTGDGQVNYFNHAAQLELDGTHPLQMLGRMLRAQRPQDVAPLYDALAAAQRGLRRLLTLGEGDQRISVSVVPLPRAEGGSGDDGAEHRQPLVLLVLGKRQVCEQLSVQGFARSVGLTPAETRVLEQLCAGLRPEDIRRRQGVAISTVRTQIGSIRAKTGAASIRELVRQVAVLPPLVGALRQMPGAAMRAG
jgi:DNA-binding CsgD family transcriptional regulator